MDYLRYPRKGDVAFSGHGEGLSSQLNIPWANLRARADTFKIAADMVVERHEESLLHRYRDELFFPIAYLYRHALELKLKNVVRLARCLQELDANEVGEALKRHDLLRLWTVFRPAWIEHVGQEDVIVLDAAESVILEFHQADPIGDALRYETNRKDEPHTNSSLPDYVCLSTLRTVFEATFVFLDCCETELEVTLQDLGEAWLAAQEHSDL